MPRFNATISGIPVIIEAETKRSAFLKTLEALSPSTDKEIRLFNISRMSDEEFEKMVSEHKFIKLEEDDDDDGECNH